VSYSNDPDKVIYSLGRVSVDDFSEILLLAGNGMGIGALKLLRGLYERALTAAYIEQEPSAATDCVEYHKIHQGRLLREAEKSFDMKKFLKPEQIDEIKNSYESAKARFEIKDCKVCGATRLNHTWTKLDIVSMAKKVGGEFENCCLAYYTQPMLQLHATPTSLITRMQIDQSDDYRSEADRAVKSAHSILILVLETQDRYFRLGLRPEVEGLRSRFSEAWS
jgi:hypothetical protein